MRKFIVLFLYSVFCFTNNYAQSIEQKIEDLYAFKITDLDEKQLEEKYKELDSFWKFLNTDTTNYLPQIREELTEKGHSSYFYFDMCSYLEMQGYNSDKNTIARALGNIKWADIGSWELVDKMHNFALNGIDVTNLVMQVLQFNKYRLTNQETGEEFNQGKLLAYLLLPLKKEVYLDKLMIEFPTGIQEAKRSIVTLLWLTNSTIGDNQLIEYSKCDTLDIDVRGYADRLINRFQPTDEERTKYDSLQPIEKKQLLSSRYHDAIINWNSESWNTAIQVSKLMHFYALKLD